MTYYTFRLLGQTPDRVECCKWDDCSSRPSDIYLIYPLLGSCNCLATKRECKHVVLAREIIKPEFINDMHLLQWDEKNSWQWLTDMTPMEEIIDVISSC